MVKQMKEDFQDIQSILQQVLEESAAFFEGMKSRPAALQPPQPQRDVLPSEGLGATVALETFKEVYAPYLSGSAGPRYLGFVTGGSTPAAIAGDWLVSVYDQNVVVTEDSIAAYLEMETINMLKDLFHLPNDYSGSFVSGATMANFVGLALARQWVVHQHGVNISQQGLYDLPRINVVGGALHSSIYKAVSMLGMGKESIHTLPSLPGREATDVSTLEEFLRNNQGEPCIVVANAGTVNTVDFDDIGEIIKLKDKYPFWLHVDAAFGGFAACSPKYIDLIKGMDQADSITIDAHKWLNVPYDSAMQFTRHKHLQVEVFQNNAAYIGDSIQNPEFIHLTPENSRRFRALPAWFTLKAYGKEGYKEVVERNVEMAQLLTERLTNSTFFRLVAPTRLNVVCFTLAIEGVTMDDIKKYLDLLKQDGRVFLTSTMYQGTPAIRAAFSNWGTDENDIEIIWNALSYANGEM
ncbi:glutamate/tyrosine decarboxylase-like PLP-dependent enzyme [Scopulibacillus darangshiensis]|uniref:Glutamate/tyrosine decarboxylase-like PLP-dependent enzyme n=1 Tax=Scopulibacillus darangshiensis TaxID=442528 RepID=A0A4R2P4J1_9BACL|nr:pyridoxal-dependent decarboxylase [Scopulibacillus darangshiensis]TCP28861.1 glutamate/tyrosine decarboxylase-like PLP-dependent enzyme [Scopulibacillus darangshiensis]